MGRQGAQRVVASTVVAITLLAGCSGRSARSAPSPTPPPSGSSAAADPTSAAAAPSPTDPDAALPLIARVRWTTTSKGRQLQVFPTAAGRTDEFPAAATRAWNEIVADAPGANTPGMQNQFLCHWNFARGADPTKTSWDLEPWRPDVGYAATVAALCNPGGPED